MLWSTERCGKNEGKIIDVFNKEQDLVLPRNSQKLYHPMVSKPVELDALIDVYVYFGSSRGYMVN